MPFAAALVRLGSLATAGIVLWAAAGGSAQAQSYSFTSLGQTITENFTGYTGSGAPTNWTAESSNGVAVAFRGIDTGTTSSGGFRAVTNPTNGAEFRGFGVAGNSSLPSELYMTAAFTNNTGAIITSLAVGYSAGEFRYQVGRLNFFTVQYSTDGVNFTTIAGLNYNAFNYTFGTNTALNGYAPGTAGTNGNFAVLAPVNVTGLSIAEGNRFYVRWVYNNTGSEGANARATLGIDDVNVTVNGGGAPAANVVWATTTGTWDTTTANWTGGSPVANLYKEGDNVTFGDIASNSVVTVQAGGVTPGTITISNAANTYTFTGGPIGGGALTKSGAGTLVLSSANAYSGGTTVNGGTLSISNDNQLGASAGSLNLNTTGIPAAVLALTGAVNSSRALTIGTGGATIATGGFNFTNTGATTINGVLTTTGAGNVSFNGLTGFSTTGTLGALNIGAGGAVTLGQPGGTINMAGGGVFNGDLIFNTTARVNFNDETTTYGGPGKIYVLGSALGAGSGGMSNIPATGFTNFNFLISNLSGSTGGIITSDIVLNPPSSGHLTGHVSFTPGNIAGATYTTASFLAFMGGTNTPGGALTINGSISGEGDLFLGNNSRTGGGSAPFILNAANTYAGNTLINTNNSTIFLGAVNTLPTTTHVIFGTLSGAAGATTLDLNGRNQQIASLSDDGAKLPGASLSITNNGLTDATLTISGAATPGSATAEGVNAFSGMIFDGTAAISLTKGGTNTLALSGLNTYTGPTAVNGGTLLVNGSGAIASSPITVNSGGTLGGDGSINSLVTLNAGGKIDPGATANAAGILNLSSLTLHGGTLQYQLNTTASSDLLLISGGALNIAAATSFTFTNLGLFGAGTYNLISGFNSITGFGLLSAPSTLAGFDLVLGSDANNVFITATASGATKTWTGAASNVWNTSAANWSPSNFVANDNVLFNDTGNNTNINVSAPVTAGTMTVDNTTAKDYTFSGAAITATALTKTNTGSLVLNSANSFTGNATVTGGTLGLGNDSALGTATLVFNGGTVLAAGGARTLSNAVSITADSTIGGSHALTLSGAATLNSGTRTLTVSNTATTTLSGVISSGGLTKDGAGTLVLSGVNTYNGGTSIDGGTLSIGSDANLGAAAGFLAISNGATLLTTASITSARALSVFGSGSFNTGGFDSTFSGTFAGAGTFIKAGAGNLTLTNQTASAIPTGPLAIGGGSLTLGQTPAFTANLMAAAAGGTWTGDLIIANGIRVNFNSPNAIDISTFSGGGQIKVLSTSTLLSTLSGNVGSTIGNAIVLNANSVAGPFVTTIGATTGGTLTLAGVISGDSDLNIANNAGTGGGAGTTILAAVNTYTGATTINHNHSLQGSIQLAINNPLPTATDVTFGTQSGHNTATLDLNGFNLQIGSLASGASNPTTSRITNNGTANSILTVGGATSPAAFQGVISDGGTNTVSLTKSGTGTLTLAGANTYTGATTINGGTLLVSGSLGNTAVAVNNGGTLAGAGTLNGVVTLHAGGKIDPGAVSAGPGATLNIASLVLSGGTLQFQLNTTSTSDRINILAGGTVNVTAATSFSFTDLGAFGAGTYNLITGFDTLTGFANLSAPATLSGFNLALGSDANNVFITATVGAGVKTWTGANSAVWDTVSANWTPAPFTFNNNDNPLFDNTGANRDITVIAGGVTIGDMTVNNTLAYSFSGGAIGGAGNLIKDSSGLLTLNNANSFTGGTTLNAGTIAAGNNAALGTGTLTINGGALQAAGSARTLANAVTVGGSFTVGGLLDFSLSGSLNLGATTPTITIDNTATTTFSGVVSNGGLTKAGTGTLVLSGANTYAGGTSIQAGTLSVSDNGNLGAVAGGLTFNGGTLLTTAAITSARAVTLPAAGGTINTGGFDSTFSSAFSGTGGFTKAGAGVLTLTGTTLPASIAVSGGTLNLSPTAGTTLNTTASATPGTFTGNVAIGTASRLNFNGGSVTGGGQVQTFVSGATIAATGTAQTTTIGNVIALNALGAAPPFTTNIGATSGNLMNITGGITGASDVNFAAGATGGAGIVNLDAASTYTGSTTISHATSGVLRLGVDNALPTSTALVFGSAAINVGAVDLNGRSQTIASLASNTTGTVNGIANTALTQATLTINGSANTSYKGVIGIPANVTNLVGANDDIALTLAAANTGTLTLTGTSTYTGATMIHGGGLVVNGSLTHSAVTVNGGTLGGTGTINGTVTLASGAIDPGSPLTTAAGTLNVGNLVLAGGTLQFQINTTSTSDRINILGGGTVNVTGATNFAFVDLGAFGAGTYNLITGFSSLTGFANLAAPPTLSGFNLTLGSDATNVFITATVAATAKTWTGSAGATWDNVSANWTPAPFTFNNNDNPLFDNTGANKDITVAVGGVTMGTMTVNNTLAYSFSGGAIGGAGNLIKDSSGLLTLNNANTYSGGTILNAGGGTLAVGNDAALGSGTLTLNGGTLQAAGSARTLANAVTVGGDFSVGGALDLTLNGNINLGGSSRVLTIDNSATTTFGGILSNGSLVKAGAGTLVLAGANTYAGTTINAGTLSVGSDANLGAAGSVTLGGGTLLTSAGLSSSRNMVVNAGGGTINTSGHDSAFSGTFNNSGAFTKSGAGNLTISGAWTNTGTVGVAAGTLTLGQASGTVNLSADLGGGTFAGNLALTNAIRVNFNTGTFSGGGQVLFNTTASSLANTGAAVSAIVGNNIVLNAGSAPAPFVTNIGATAGNTLTINGVISGAADVNLSVGASGGAGVLNLNAANTWTGATTLGKSTAGVVRLGVNDALPTTTALVFGSGSLNVGAVDLNGRSQTIASLASNTTGTVNGIANTSAAAATLTINGSAATTFKGVIGVPANTSNLAGANNDIALILSAAHSGTLTLTGANTYTGGTTIAGGTLVLGSSTTLADTGAVLVSGGTLDIGAANETIGALTITGGSIVGAGMLTVSALDMQAGLINAMISGAAAPNKTSGGTTTLAAANTYTGLTTISNGTLLVTANGALGATGAGNGTVVNGGTLEIGAGVNYAASEELAINGTGGGLGALRLASGTATFAGGITAATHATIFSGGTFNLTGPITKNGTTLTLAGGGTFNVSGGIGGASPNSDLVVDGTTVNLSGINSYNGPTTIQNSGTVNLLGNNVLPIPLTDMTITGAGSTLNMNGFSDSVATLSGNGVVTSTASGGALAINPSSGASTFSGSITGGANMSVTKTGAGKQVLSGTSTYTGTTNVNGGTLEIAAGGSLSSSGAVNVNAGGILAGNGTVGDITISSGATVAPGSDAPGNLSASSATLSGGGIFQMQINDATGGAGVGWDQLQLGSGNLDISSLTPGSQFIVNLQSLTISNTPGSAANFNSATAYTWEFLNYGTLGGTFASNLFQLNAGGFANPLGGGSFSIINDLAGTALAVQFIPNVAAVPEPSSLLLASLAAAGLGLYRRRQGRQAGHAPPATRP